MAGVVFALAVIAPTAGGATSSTAGVVPQAAWAGFAHEAQHTAVAPASPQPLTSTHWQVSVDHKPICCAEGPSLTTPRR